MKPETHHYSPGPATMKPCAVDGELCYPFPDRESPTCSWHWFLARLEATGRKRALFWAAYADCWRPARTVCVESEPLAARKQAEAKIEVVFEQFTTDAETALLYRILRRRGWSDDRSDAVLHKARW